MARHKRIVAPSVDKMVREPEQSGPEPVVEPSKPAGSVRVVAICDVVHYGKRYRPGTVLDVSEEDYQRFLKDNIFRKTGE